MAPAAAPAVDSRNCRLEILIVFSSLVLRLHAPVHKLDIKYRAVFVTMTGLAAPGAVPTKNPPAQPSGFENFFSALAVFILRPQAVVQIGAATALYQISLLTGLKITLIKAFKVT